MKPVRSLLIILGIVLVLGVVVAALALTPAVQRWAVLRAVAGQPGLKLQVQSVSAGFSSVSLRGVELEREGLVVKLDELDTDLSLWALLINRELEIGRMQARGLLVDASHLSPAKAGVGAAAAPAAAPAALARLELPYAVTLREVDIEGRALVATAAGGPPLPAEFKITGGELAPGKEGTLRLKAKISDPTPGAIVTGLQANLSLQLKQSLRRTFDHVALTALIDADGPQFDGQNQLKVAASLARGTSGEEYLVRVDTARSGKLENILAINAQLPAGQKSYTGEWTLAARDSQLQPFFLGGVMPKFDARGNGRFSFAPATDALTLQGQVQTEASGLEAVRPELRAIGAVKLRSEFDVAVEKGLARLNKLVVSVAGEQPVLELRASSAADFNLHDRRLQVGGSSPGEVARLKFQGVPFAWIRPFVSAADISGGVITGEIVYENAGGQKLVARTTTPFQADGVTVVREGRPLVTKAGLTLDAAAEFSPERVQVKVNNLGFKTAAGDLIELQATVSAPVADQPSVTIEATGSADLPKLFAPLLPVGRLRAKGALDATWHGAKLELRRLTAEAADEKKQTLVSIATARTVSFDFATLQVEGAAAGEIELARVTLGHLPLGAFARFSPGWNFAGSLAQGDFLLVTHAEKLVLSSNAPLKVVDFSLGKPGQPLLADTTVQASPRVELTSGAITKLSSGEVALAESSGTNLGKLSIDLTRDSTGRVDGSATFGVELPGFASQPLGTRAEPLSAGRASGEVRFVSAAGALQVEARATLNGLVTRDTNQTMPVANLSLRTVLQPDGKVSVRAPILIDQAGNRSDLNLAVDGSRGADGDIEVESKLTGEHIELGDALLLFDIFGFGVAAGDSESAAAQTRALSPPSADAKPFWSGFRGKFDVEVKSLTRGQDWSMRNLRSQLTLTPQRVALANLAAEFSATSKLAAQGSLDFAGGPEPYHLTGDFSLTEFDVGKYFKAADPGRPPTIEGIFNTQGQFEGHGLTLEDTLDRARGTFNLTGRQGVFRGLKRTSDKISIASKAVGLVGSLLGDKSADKIANVAYQVDQIAQVLGELPYDQLNMKMTRDASLNLQIQDVSLVSQEVRLLGKGQVTYTAGKRLFDQPLTATLSLRARGKVEELLAKRKILEETRDELGYLACKEPVNLGGTLLKPDPTAFFTRLAVEKLSDLLNSSN